MLEGASAACSSPAQTRRRAPRCAARRRRARTLRARCRGSPARCRPPAAGSRCLGRHVGRPRRARGARTGRAARAPVTVHEDVGVAGLHRLAPALDVSREADCVVVVAGQDAALASVVGGLSPRRHRRPDQHRLRRSLRRRLGAARRCSPPARRASRSSTSTTASAPARSPPASLAPPAAHVTRLLYVDCFAGVAGDMLLGALLDAGAASAPSATDSGGLGVTDSTSRWARRAPRDRARARRGDRAAGAARTALGRRPRADRRRRLPARARERAHAVFRRLAEAEGRVHGIAPEEVHFHEVGAVDAIADVCGVALRSRTSASTSRLLAASRAARLRRHRPRAPSAARAGDRRAAARARRSTASTSTSSS